MSWVIPQFPRERVNEAGRALVVADSLDRVDYQHLQVISNWRSSHSFPLNTFQIGLRKRARQVDRRSLVAQRLKRLSSIVAKLRRFPDMRLSQMQDIAGCRAIVASVPETGDRRDVFLILWRR